MLEIRISRHAQEEIVRRSIPLALLETVVRHPQQVLPAEGDKTVHQSRVVIDEKDYLIRVIVVETPTFLVVVTAYRTSRISKYWRNR